MKTAQYLLKAEPEFFRLLDRLRQESDETRADYIRSAVAMKNEYMMKVAQPVLKRQRQELEQIQQPLSFFMTY